GGLSYLVDKESVPLNFIKLATENKETTTQDITYRSLSVSIPPNNDSCIVGDLLQEIPPKIPKKDRHYHKDKVDFKMGIVKRVLQSTDHNTPERALLIRELAAKERYPFGAKRGQYVGKNTIRRWLSEYENKGLTAICRKRRTDSGQSRVIISRAWDNEVKKLGLTDNEIQKMAVSLKRHIASLWRSGTPSVPTIQLNALPFAVNQIMQKGCTLSKEELTHICELPQKLIQRESHYKAVNTYRQDAARSAAIQTPRIKRSRDHLKPMEWVAGDVHHIDIAFKRDDGSNCTIKAVAWLDLATNRAFITPFLMPKGEMIRREHVIESFVSMCEHSNWGVPTKLYLDRGGEYNWGEFVEDLCRLKRSIEIHDLHDLDEEDSTGVQRSRAYNPQSKVIETLFAALEKSIFSQIQGYIGGNRMQKKTENQGKSPKPYDGDLESFKATLHTVLAYYHHKKQNGHLKGKSPNQAFEESINAGWKSLLLDSSELEVAFCKKVFREVRAGGVFMWDNQEYRHDALIAMAGNRKVLVGAPLFGNKNRLYLWNEEEEPIGLAEPVKSFSFDDIKGSGEQKRQNSVLNKQIRQMESDTDKLDLEKIMSEVIEVMGAEPKAESKGVVSIDSHHRYLANEAQKKPALTPDDEYIENRRRQSALLEGLAQKLKVANGE
ncbi:MAG: hypothetical protein KGZ85_07335, partial [Ignavibacterium sp.]|nr:hypothetical protein [Ignavibacterium sp.]